MYAIPGNVARISVEGHWADHIARGSPGGTDFPDGYGTPMRAMRSGVVVMVDNNPGGSGGRTIKIRHGDDTFTEELHAHWITARVGDTVGIRGQVGTSGASGFGVDRYYGPHIHAHGVYSDGRRFDLEPLIDWSNPTAPAGGGGGGGFIPIDESNQTGEEIMQTIYYQGPASWGIFGPGAADPGWQETTDLATAQGWGKRWGAHPISEEEKPKNNGSPWEHITDPKVWAAMKAQAELEREVAKSLAANVTVPEIKVAPLVIDDATIAALAQANAAAFFAEQKKAGN